MSRESTRAGRVARMKAFQQNNKAAGKCRCGSKRKEGYTRCDKCVAATQAMSRAVRELVTKARMKPCVDCDCTYPPECMDLDHVRGKPDRSSTTRKSIKAAQRELDKCDVRCPTCHRLRHYNEKNGTKWVK